MLKLAFLPFFAAIVMPPVVPSAPQDAGANATEFKKQVVPFVKKYCVSCHGPKDPADGIDLSKYKTIEDVMKNTKVWKKSGREVDSAKMPPKDSKQPSAKEKTAFTTWAKSLPRS